MINYSITTKAVNANLFDINLAKARVSKAKEAGTTPDPADVELANSELETKAFGVAQYSEIMTIEQFAKHISKHGCVYSRADIAAILYMAVDCMREQLLEGKKIRLGDLGDFSVSLVSKGVESADKFNSALHITGINVNWDCGDEFKNLLADAEFNLVASRAAQAAVLKAIKNGETIVDLKAKGESDENVPGSGDTNTDHPTPNTPSGGSTKAKVTLMASPSIGGTVTGAGDYDKGSSVEIKAVPQSGYTFSKWSDNNTSATRTVTVTSDLNLTAIFTADNSNPADDENIR